MAENKNKGSAKEHSATARLLSAPISTKQSVEISYHLRYEDLAWAKAFLEEVVAMRKPVPYRRATMDLGHKPGMAGGRFPQKAASHFLQLLKSVEANAQFKGLNTSSLKISKLIANKASIPFSGGRGRHATKRTHIEIEVIERKQKKNDNKKEEKAVKGDKKEKIMKQKGTERSE
ncbi:50S ribosomal protein L22 [Candidatus Woesearchaeota archaeon]|nr:50S ribosomal protein L22 [Candidatus Woesearchaeota archaeon]